MKEDKYLLVYDRQEFCIYRFIEFVPYTLDTYFYLVDSCWLSRGMIDLELPLPGEQHPLVLGEVFQKTAKLINDCFCSIRTILLTEPRIPENTFNIGDCYIGHRKDDRELSIVKIVDHKASGHTVILFTTSDTSIYVQDSRIDEEEVVKWKQYYHVSSSCFEKIESLFYSTRDSVYELFEPYVSLSEEDWKILKEKCEYIPRVDSPIPYDM